MWEGLLMHFSIRLLELTFLLKKKKVGHSKIVGWRMERLSKSSAQNSLDTGMQHREDGDETGPLQSMLWARDCRLHSDDPKIGELWLRG